MKTVACCCLMAIILSTGTVSAQVLLRPQAVGSAHFDMIHHRYSARWSHHEYRSALNNRYDRIFSTYVTYIVFNDGVIEFNIDFTSRGAPFPLPGMTDFNWIAMLTGIKVEFASDAGNNCNVNLLDLQDSTEDGFIHADDWMWGGNIICEIIETLPSAGQIIDPINVTQALRNDLFGSRTEGVTSGFYLKSEHLDGIISYNRSLPRLEISYLPTSTPSPIPTVTPTPSRTPTPSPTSTPIVPKVRIWMPSHDFQPSSLAACFVYVMNPGHEGLFDVKLVVVLDVNGQFFFAPEFDNSSWYIVDALPGEIGISVLEPFAWPEGCGSAEDIRWYAAMTDPSMTTIISNIDTFTFGWSE